MTAAALRFVAPAREALTAAAIAAYPDEACGVCVARDDAPEVIVRVERMRNAAADPRRAFAFDDGEHLALLRRLAAAGERPRAVFHSHPDGDATLSARDLAAAFVDGAPLWPGVDWIVVATRGAHLHDVRRYGLTEGERVVAHRLLLSG